MVNKKNYFEFRVNETLSQMNFDYDQSEDSRVIMASPRNTQNSWNINHMRASMYIESWELKFCNLLFLNLSRS